MHLILAAGGDLFSVGHNISGKVGHLGLEFLVIAVGIIAIGLVITHRHVAAVLLVIAAIIPVWFLGDSSGAAHSLLSTVKSIAP